VADQFDASFAAPVTVKIGVSWGKIDAPPAVGHISSSQTL